MLTAFLKNVRLIDPYRDRDEIVDCLLEDGVIRAIGKGIPCPDGVNCLDLHEIWLVPGLVDIHCHLREPGEEYKETIETGTMAAVAGGFTTICAMPNTTPPNDCGAVTQFILAQSRRSNRARVLPIAAVTKGQKGLELTEFGDLLSNGAVAFSDDGLPVRDPRVMRLALEYSLNFNAVICTHSEVPELSERGAMNEGRMSTLLGLRGIPNCAEDIAVYRDIRLSELTGARLHICHVSTKEAVELIREAKKRGVPCTAETAPHYFSLTEEAVDGYNTLAKMNPPLRTEEDRVAVIEGIKDGTIDCIATDHAPHSVLEKECEFEKAKNGIIGLETAVPLGLRLVRDGHISEMKLVELMTKAPTQVLDLEEKGVQVGQLGEFALIDPKRHFEVKQDNLFSRSWNTPFLGETLEGRCVATIFKGKVVFDLDGLFTDQSMSGK